MGSNRGVKRLFEAGVLGVRQVGTRTVARRALAATFTALVMVCLCSGAAFAQCTLTGTLSTWNDGNSNWNTASNWKPAGVPNSSTTSVCITNGTSAVNLDINASVDNLQLAKGNTLSFNGNTQLSAFGTQIINGGQILVNGGNGTNTYMFVDNSMTLSGAGSLTLSDTISGGGNAYLYANNGAATLTNQSTIQGEGLLGDGTAMTVVNQSGGIINANSSGGALASTLQLDTAAGVTNTGLMEATNSGVLQILNTAVNNASGNITANGSKATVELIGATIQGGTLNTLSGGTLGSFGTVVLDGTTNGTLTLSGGSTYTVEGNTQTDVLGTINNKGNIAVNGGGGTNTYLLLKGSTTLQGGGTVTMTSPTSGGGNSYIYQNASGLTLTNVNNTIQGEGLLGDGTGLAVVNQSGGIINANSTGGGGTLNTVLQIDTAGAVSNAGLMEASNSGVLEITGTTVNNAGGTIKPNSGAVVQLDGGTVIQGGTLTNNGGTLQTVGTATLDGSTSAGAVTLNGTYTGSGNSQTHVLGTINNNTHIQVNGGGGTNTYLLLYANTTLQGGGTVTLNAPTSGGGNAYLYSNVGPATLTNVNNTIQGEGLLGDGTAMTLVNQSGGTINANSTGTPLNTVLQLNVAGSGGNPGVVNQGLMESSNSGLLEISGTTVNNAGGNIKANAGSVVQLDSNTIIQGGTLTSNGGTVQTVGTATLDGSTALGAVTINGTYTGSGNSQTHTLGTFNNNGNILVNGGAGTNTYLLLYGNTTLQGGGTVTLHAPTSGGGNAYLYSNVGAATLTNVNNTIQGEGILGDGTAMTLVNQSSGTINANSTGGPLNTTLLFNPGVTATNQGLMEATKSGELLIQSTTVNNKGGNITANGSTAAVVLNGATIQGGTLNTLTGGTFENVGNGTILDGSTQGALTLSKGSTFTGAGNSQTAVFGTFNNSGNILVSGGGGTNTYLFVNGKTTLQGGGTVTLSAATSGGGNAYLYANDGATTLTNVNNTIQGEGVFGDGTALTIVNQASGVINANSTGSPLNTTLLFNPGVIATNQGLMEATNSGVLLIQSTTINNAGGNITANGGKATVELNGADIQGGTINTLSSGTFENIGLGTTLDGKTQGAMTLNGTFTGAGNTQTVIFGTFNNNGNIQINGGGGTNTYLFVNGSTTLQGNGKGLVTLNNTVSGGGSTYLYANAGAATLTNTNNTIQGAGVIGDGTALTIINNGGGTILANLPGQTLLLNGAAPVTNNGTMEVTAGGTGTGTTALQVTSPFTNFSGNTLTGGTYIVNGVAAQGTLQINAFGTTGSEIVNNAANITLNGPNSSIVDQNGLNALTKLAANSTSTSSFTVEGGRTFTTAGNFTNNGTLTVGSGSLFDVNGNLTNISGSTISGGTYNLTGILKANNASGITIDSANITLTGSGALENQSGANALTGLATISSGASFAINGGANFTTAGNFTNNGTMTVGSSNSKFDVKGNLTNFNSTTNTLTGGTYSLTGTLQFNGANIITNAANITLTGTSSQIVDQSGVTSGLRNLATNASTGKLTVAGGRVFTTSGAFINNGSLTTTGSGSKFTTGGSASFTNNGTLTTTGGDSEVATGASGSFTNNGTLTVSSGSTFNTGGTFKNLSGTTLTGGTYNVTGTMQYNSTSDIATNAAAITLTGSTAKIIDSNSKNALAGLATNTSTGKFAVSGGQALTDSATAFSNAGSLSVGTGSALTLSSATATYTQTGGTTTVDGTLTAKGGIKFTGGSVFGNGGTLNAGTNTVTNGAIFNIGDKVMTAGKEGITGAYGQISTGALDVDIGGTTAGTLFDQLTISAAASLNGTLNLDLINSFVPKVGETFDILNASSVAGKFSTLTGTSINSSEHFTVVYNPTNVTLDVVSGAAPSAFLGRGKTGPDSPTPEPSTLLLLGTGLLLAAHYARRRAAGKRGDRSGN